MGNVNAFKLGEDSYSIAQMNADPLALDGVSCSVCHQITPESMGKSSGNFLTSDNQTIYGPYPNPFGNPMINHTGYTPVHSDHIKDSRLCASCHTLLTNPVDLDGVPTGGEFVEQAPFQEWENSIYPEQGTSCYSCHVPEIDDVVKISSMPPSLNGRTPFGKHHFAGANVFMLKILRNNIDALGITADIIHFDSTINRTIENLQLKSLGLNMLEIKRTPDTLSIDIELMNLAGHKLPSAYPSRRVFIELFAINNFGDTIFHSGKFDSNSDIIEEDEIFEPHYNNINSPEQVQIYEMVMGDVNGDYTTVLERSAMHLKDNRIPPVGFTTSHFNYDTIKIVGNALTDVDFNKTDGNEGSGKDLIHFNIPLNNDIGDINISAKVYYQTVTNRWLEDMFSYSSDDIDSFKAMYDAADKSPVLMGSISLSSVYTSLINNTFAEINIFPNPSHGFISIESDAKVSGLSVYSVNGQLVKKLKIEGSVMQPQTLFVSSEKGIYFIVLETDKKKVIRKIVIN